ncbi:armadillo-type protein [Umbelopsis sp. PMI_123]|nr:armadillo-type protein [Umbelopsis sp. PMI_123]
MPNNATIDVEQEQRMVIERLRPSLESLNRIQDRINLANSKHVSALLESVVQVLNTAPDLAKTVTTYHITSIIQTLVNLYRLREQGEPLPTKVAELWLTIVHILLSRTAWRDSMGQQELQQYIVYFTLNINPSPFNAETQIKSSEELKQIAVNCISSILPAKYQEGRKLDETYEVVFGDQEHFWKNIMALRDDSFWLPLNHTLNVLRNLAVQEQNLQLRLDTIQALSQLTLDNLMNVDLLASIMAGLTSGLAKIILQNGEKEHHQVVVSSLQFLGDFICAVMNDEGNFMFLPKVTGLKELWELNKNQSGIETNDEQHNNNQETPNATKGDKTSQKVERTKGWFAYTKTRLRDLISNVLKLRQHPDWRARIAFVKFANDICSKCALSMEDSIPMLIETMVLYVDDEYPQVADTTKHYLQALSVSTEFADSLLPMVKEKLYQWMTALPRYIFSGNDKEQRTAISMVTGFITLLGSDLQISLDLNFPKIIDSWLSMMEYDSNDLRMVEDRGEAIRYQELQEANLDLPKSKISRFPMYPNIHFKHINSDRATSQLALMLQHLGKYGDVRALTDIFMTKFFEGTNPEWQPQCAYTIIHLLIGNADSTFEYQEGFSRVVKSVLEQFIEIDLSQIEAMQSGAQSALITYRTHWHTPTSNVYSTATIITICNCLHAIGVAISLMTKKDVTSELITILYPLLSYYGSTNLHVHTFAKITLEAISQRCGYADVKTLIIDNIDYVINEISLRLPSLLSNLSLPHVLQALIKLGNMNAVKYLDDSIDEIFEALDRYHMNQIICKDLCAVLIEIVQAVEHDHILHHPKQQSAMEVDQVPTANTISKEVAEYIRNQKMKQSLVTESADEREPTSMEEIGNYFLEHQKKKEEAEIDTETTEMQDELGAVTEKDLQDLEDMARADAERWKREKEDQAPQPTYQQKRILDILRKTHHFLTSPQPQLRSQILLLMTAAIPVLSDNTKELYPIVHTIWPAIVRRLDDQEHYVVMNATSLLQTVAECCSDFLTQRVVTDVWPRFQRVLDQTSKQQRISKQVYVSTSNNSYSVYSKEHKMIYSILTTLKEIVLYVPLKHQTLHGIINSTRWYLAEMDWHPQIQDAAVDLYKPLYEKYPDITWLSCLGLLGRHRLVDVSRDPLLTQNMDSIKIPDWFEQDASSDFVKNVTRVLYGQG